MSQKATPMTTGPRAGWRPRVGPGLILAAAAGIAIWQLAPDARNGKPKIGHTPAATYQTVGLSAPDPAWLSAHDKLLGLTDEQLKKLKALKDRWDTETKELRAELDRASGQFSTQVTPRTATDLQQVREQTGPVSQLTHQLLEARKAWWAEASTILTPSQRAEAEKAWAHRFEQRTGGQSQ